MRERVLLMKVPVWRLELVHVYWYTKLKELPDNFRETQFSYLTLRLYRFNIRFRF